MNQPPRTRYLRRAVGIVLCLSPVALLLASLIYGLFDYQGITVGFAFVPFALFLGVVNTYLSWIRPWRYYRRHGTMEGMRNVSGIPVLGTLCLLAAGIFGFGDVIAAIVGLIAAVLDTGGLPWFLVMTWKDGSFWDE